jgi:hypothetical protein
MQHWGKSQKHYVEQNQISVIVYCLNILDNVFSEQQHKDAGLLGGVTQGTGLI